MCNVIKLRISSLSHQQIFIMSVGEIFIFLHSKKTDCFLTKKDYIKIDVSCV